MGIWDTMKAGGEKVKAGAERTKLQGELVLLDRELLKLKSAFGVDLYDLLISFEKGLTMGTTKMFGLQQTHLSEPFNSAKKDIAQFAKEQEELHKEQFLLTKSMQESDCKKKRGSKGKDPQTATVGDTFAQAGRWVTTNVRSHELEAKIHSLDHDITRRKESFGVTVYDEYVAKGMAEPEPKASGGILATGTILREHITYCTSHFSENEKLVQNCLDHHKNIIHRVQQDHNEKLGQIAKMNEILNG